MPALTAQQSLDLALDYTAMNPTRYIFPVDAGKKFPPLIKDNLAQASNDPGQIREWAQRFPRCNWGVGHKKSRLFVVDIDTKPGKNGQATFDWLEIENGLFPETEETRTPSGGRHLIYEGEHIFRIGVNGFGEDVDSPHYTIIPGCQLSDGATYQLVRAGPTEPAPQWFYDLFASRRKSRFKQAGAEAGEAAVELDKPENVAWAIDFLKEDAEPAIEGKSGDLQTLKIAMGLRDKGISPEKAFELMFDYYNDRCDPPWDPDDLQRKVDNAYNYASGSQLGGKTAEADFEDDDLDLDAIPSEATPERIERERKLRQELKDRAEQREPTIDQTAKKKYNLVDVLDEFAYVADIDRFVKVNQPNVMWKKVSFDSYFATLSKKRKFSDALLNETNSARAIRKFQSVGYVPGAGISLEGGLRCNLYRPSGVEPKPGDTTFWDEHLEFLFPDPVDRNHLLNWLAWFYQNLNQKPKHALLLQGRRQGTGKSFIADMLAQIIGPYNSTAVSQTDLASSFNGYAMRTKLIVIEELRAVERMGVKTALHDIITQDRISINEKNMPKFEMENCFGIIGMTNDDAAISLDKSDRRYLVLRTSAKPKDVQYYAELYGYLKRPEAVAAIAYQLQTRDVGEYNGAGRAPYTSAKDEMIQSGYSELESFLLEHSQKYPLSGRVTTVADVMALLPARLERSGRVTAAVCSALKTHFKAELAGQFRTKDGLRQRLYVINGSGLMNIQGWRERIVDLYELDRAKAGEKSIDDDDGVEDGSELTADNE